MSAPDHSMRTLLVIGDVVGPFVIAGAWMGYVSEIAAVVALLYYVIQILLAIPALCKLFRLFKTRKDKTKPD